MPLGDVKVAVAPAAADDAKDALESQASDFRGSLGLIKLERDEDRAQMAQEMKEQYGRIVLATTRARLRQKSMNCFVTWRVRTAKHKATQQLHRKIVLRLRNFRASHAFGAWLRWVRWHRRALEITGRSLARLRHSQISAVVCLWRSETSRSEAEKLAKAVLGKQAADFRGAIGLVELEKEEDMTAPWPSSLSLIPGVPGKTDPIRDFEAPAFFEQSQIWRSVPERVRIDHDQ